jgi:putative RNA 2'-phosphotransferase
MGKELKRKSKYITLLLRHQPEKEDLHIDRNGWVDVTELTKKLKISKSDLDEIVVTDNKNRFSYSKNKTKIRCNQGHSIDVDVELIEMKPPDVLYHGTATRFLNSIFETGIDKRNRNHVHLSADIETAEKVGSRHGNIIVLIIDTKEMYADGIKFYLSVNNVWLTDYIDRKYIKLQ